MIGIELFARRRLLGRPPSVVRLIKRHRGQGLSPAAGADS